MMVRRRGKDRGRENCIVWPTEKPETIQFNSTESMCVHVIFVQTCTQCVDTNKEWSKVGAVGSGKVKVTAFNVFHPKMFASASTHPLAGQGLIAGPCGPPGFQTGSLWLRLNLAWLLTLRFHNTPRGKGSRSLKGWSLMHRVISQGTRKEKPNELKTINTRHARKQTWLKTKTGQHSRVLLT